MFHVPAHHDRRNGTNNVKSGGLRASDPKASIAKRHLATMDMSAITKDATDAQFFTRNTVFNFADGSVLYIQMYGASYATDGATA